MKKLYGGLWTASEIDELNNIRKEQKQHLKDASKIKEVKRRNNKYCIQMREYLENDCICGRNNNECNFVLHMLHCNNCYK